MELYLHSPNMPSLHGAQFKKKAQGKFYLLPFIKWLCENPNKAKMKRKIIPGSNTKPWRTTGVDINTCTFLTFELDGNNN
jgi:hypothetical protein